MRTVIILSLGILLLCGVIIMAQQQGKKAGSECTPSGSQSNSAGEEAAQFNCLPDDITLQDIVTYSIKPERNETVRDKLLKLKAKCENGKLVDEHSKEIRFFRLECWGNPPADYEERQQNQQDKLKELEKKYTVIVMGCDLRMQ